MENDLIDGIETNQNPNDFAMNLIRWWEKKRLLFNSIILLVAFLGVALASTSNSGRIDQLYESEFFILSLLYFILINACYCVGWGIQLLAFYYFKIQHHSNALDIVLFVLGTSFTSLVTYSGYHDYLF